jgi:hypothetical protein
MKTKFSIRWFALMAAIAAIRGRSAFLRLSDPQRPGGVQFANIAEGTAATGNKPYIADAALAKRFMLVKLGSDANHVAASGANTDIPLGVATDSVATADLEVPVNVAVLGAAQGTQLVQAGGTIAAGDMIQSKGDGTAITLLTTTGTFYIIGRALSAGVDGGLVEFAPCLPMKVVNA